jgi:tRNA U38,U39,U40 pseudouridine synthase TruA
LGKVFFYFFKKRSCRTDKGVHAIRNLITAKIKLNVDEKEEKEGKEENFDKEKIIQLINEKLSNDKSIIVMGIKIKYKI